MPIEALSEGQRGAALICTLMVTALLATLGSALVLLMTTESLIGANHRQSHEALYAAQAGVEQSAAELEALADWRALPAATGSAISAFRDGASGSRLADGTRIDLARLSAELQADTDSSYGTSANRPVWQLYGHGPLASLPADAIRTQAYVVIWIADDADDRDADPLHDSNDVVLVRADAFGARGARRRIEVTLSRSSPGLIAWRQVR